MHPLDPTLQRPGLALRHWPAWLPEPDRLLETLQQQIHWRQEQITLFGRTHALPRLTCWMADPGLRYRYSGLEQQADPWLDDLDALRTRLSSLCGHPLNSLLLNFYRDGADAMGCHADDEPELEPGASIVSLSLGATRTLRFKPKPRSGVAAGSPGLSLELGHGDVLLMDPPTQQHWLHELPRRKRVDQPRINLTFRQLRAPN
ncbi:MAG: alpha-ketoglutarate-dependent dioxygenase AlkB [Cyanobacteriota bacterium]|nr:alpha-ketoglutarate-dependent dioxygenase AlkB [Cyanobacteriota bacterium]